MQSVQSQPPRAPPRPFHCSIAKNGSNPQVTEEEVRASVATARDYGFKVAAHAHGATVLVARANCVDEAEVAETFRRIDGEMGRVDVLVNNVGQSARERAAEFHESSSDVWRFVIDVSLMSTLIASRQVAGAMRAAKSGRIVNMASTAGLSGEVRVAEYSAAKMGVIGFTRSLAQELAPFGVNVNAVCPGVTRTAALDGLGPDITAEISAKIPMRTINEPEDIAAAVAFLASDDARRITGQSLVVDGGHWMV